jgi:hypothetical protein
MTNSPRPQLIADAVVAQYIHEISARHRVSEPGPDRPQEGWPAAVNRALLDDIQPLAA